MSKIKNEKEITPESLFEIQKLQEERQSLLEAKLSKVIDHFRKRTTHKIPLNLLEAIEEPTIDLEEMIEEEVTGDHESLNRKARVLIWLYSITEDLEKLRKWAISQDPSSSAIPKNIWKNITKKIATC